MKTVIFDLETFGLHANDGVLLCCAYKEYGHDKTRVIRADEFPTWKNHRSNVKDVCGAIIDALKDFDIFIAHNGQYFDKALIVSWALRHNLPLFMRFSKFIDPVLQARKHLRLSRNDLATVADFLGVPMKKTSIKWDHWRQAAYDGDRRSMDYIVEHCIMDIAVLEAVHSKTRRIVKDINERGSAF